MPNTSGTPYLICNPCAVAIMYADESHLENESAKRAVDEFVEKVGTLAYVRAADITGCECCEDLAENHAVASLEGHLLEVV